MVFSGGVHGTPLCTNGSAGYLMQLTVKVNPAIIRTYVTVTKITLVYTFATSYELAETKQE